MRRAPALFNVNAALAHTHAKSRTPQVLGRPCARGRTGNCFCGHTQESLRGRSPLYGCLMRFGYLHSMAPCTTLKSSRRRYRQGCARCSVRPMHPGEYERLLRGVPMARFARLSNVDAPRDHAAWKAVNTLTAAKEAADTAEIQRMRPRLVKVLADKPYDLDVLLCLPRLLDDPVDTAGVRLLLSPRGSRHPPASSDAPIPSTSSFRRSSALQGWGAAPFITASHPYGMPRTNANAACESLLWTGTKSTTRRSRRASCSTRRTSSYAARRLPRILGHHRRKDRPSPDGLEARGACAVAR